MTDLVLQFKFRTQVGNPNTFLYNTGPVRSLGDPNLNIKQFYDVTVIRNPGQPSESRATVATNLPVAPVNIGPRSTPDYEASLAAGGSDV